MRAAAVAVAVCAVLAATLPSTAVTPKRFASGWLPYWNMGAATRTVEANATLFSDVSPFWYHLKSGDWVVWRSGVPPGWVIGPTVRAMRRSGVAVIPTVTEDYGARAMAALLSSPRRRAEHVRQIVRLAVLNRFAGVDLDYEAMAFGPAASRLVVKRQFPVLLRQLARALHAHRKVLAVTIPARTSALDPNWRVFDYPRIGAAADKVRIMAYDFHTSGSSAGPIAPLPWVTAVAGYAASVIRRSKVQLGVPTYGYDWVTRVVGRCPASNRPATVSRTTRQMIALATSRGAHMRYHRASGETTFAYRARYTGTTRGRYASCLVTRRVWFPIASSSLGKARLAARYHLGGVVFWALGTEDSGQWRPLRRLARQLG